MDQILRVVRELTAAQFGIATESVTADRAIVELGGDSLSLLALSRKLHDRFGVRVPVRELFDPAMTPRALAGRFGAVDDPEPVPSPVDFSLYFFGAYDPRRARDGYQDLLRAAEFADDNGFRAVWLPERHFHEFGGLFPNPAVLAAAIATRTSNIRLHAGSVVLPLHNPIRVAEEWSMVDNISGGRAGMCVASGWHANDFALAPENFGRQREVMYESLDVVRQLWSGAEVTGVSGGGEPVRLRLHPLPEQSEPPLAVAVLSNPDSYARAAWQGLDVVTNLMQQDVTDLAANIALYRRSRAEAGLDPAGGRVVVLVHTYLATDGDRARAEAFEPFVAYLRSSLSLFDNVLNSLGIEVDLSGTPEDDLEFLLERAYASYCRDRALIGDPRQARPLVNALVAAGVDEIACFVDFGLPGARMLAGLPVLADLSQLYRRPEYRPASAAQRRMWLMDRMYPGRHVHHEPKALLLEGPLDLSALRTALTSVAARHAPLRTTFREVVGSLRQVVREPGPFDCPIVDLVGHSVETAVAILRDRLCQQGLDLADGPVVRAAVGVLGPQRQVLFLNAHHIVFDSASTSIFYRDLAACYRNEPEALPSLDPGWVADESVGDVEFWRATLRDATPLHLPTDRPRTGAVAEHGDSIRRDLDADLARQLRAFGRANGSSPFMVLLAALGFVLGRFANQDDLVLGTAVSIRPPGAQELVGMFVETVAVRLDVSDDPSLAELTAHVRERLGDAIDHCDVPFDVVVDAVGAQRVAGENPLCTVLVEYEQGGASTFDDVFRAAELSATVVDVPRAQAPFDLTIYLSARDDGVGVVIEYDTALFDRATVRRLLDQVEQVLRGALLHPSAPLSGIDDSADQSVLAGEVVAHPDVCLHKLVDDQAARTPEALALVTDDGDVTYARLVEFANRLAHQLVRDGVVPGDRVAVSLPRGPGLIAALLAVLKCGAAYVPIDPGLPKARQKLMVEDCAARLVLTDTRVEDLPGTAPEIAVLPDAIAYCIYTSGSSGTPKAVAVAHRGPVNLVHWQLRHHPPLTTAQWTSASFDVSVQEIFSTLAAGATLVLVDDATRRDPAAMAEHLRRHRVQRLCMPVAPLNHLVTNAPVLPDLREVFVAGEPLVLAPLLRFLAVNPELALFNQYGPTEASVIVTEHRVETGGPPAPPIGTLIDNIVGRVVDETDVPVPVGAVGELLVGGVAVAAGYLGDEDRTRQRFVTISGVRFYRTGDLVRLTNGGVLAYLGRLDEQVKIRGYRVEPGETRTALCGLAEVNDCAVLVDRTAAQPTLSAYVVLGEPLDDWVHVLRGRLARQLPSYLVPQRWTEVDELPIGSNGKLDRNRLAPAEPVGPRGAPARTETECAVQRIWCAELDATAIPVDRSLFDVGGDSLTLVRLLERMRSDLGSAPPVADFMREPTIQALATWFEEIR